ncbi:hypothetical protein UlMin_042379 [Ulmus minor]
MERPKTTITRAIPPGKPLTTFVETDTDSFKEVVQRLTGHQPSPPPQAQQSPRFNINMGPPRSPTIHMGPPALGPNRPTKLHERRLKLRPKLEIVKPTFHFRPPSSPTEQNQGLSFTISPPNSGNSPGLPLFPSPAGNSPSVILSKLSIEEDQKKKKGEASSSSAALNQEDEENAIKERRFYLHPSPRGGQGRTKPELLTLFPLTSPKATEKDP